MKSEKEAAEAKFKFALVDGRKEQVILGASSYGHGEDGEAPTQCCQRKWLRTPLR